MKNFSRSRHHVLIPGKTFLLGEYLALAGGPSIVANTAPCFDFSWQSERDDEADAVSSVAVAASVRHPFHKNSPAGQWLKGAVANLHNSRVEHLIQFSDPHNGRGGLGASTAEFIGAWIFRKWLKNPEEWSQVGSLVTAVNDHRQHVTPNWKSERFGSARFRDLLDDYRTTTTTGSGADLVSQIAGAIAVWDARADEMRRFNWPFRDLSFSLFVTGKKLATHEHLAKMNPLTPSEIDDMRIWVEEAVQSMALEDADRFIASVRGFGKVLSSTGRVAEHSRELLEELGDCSGVRAAKGCGAMGSDILFVLHDRSQAAELDGFRETHSLRIAGTNADVVAAGASIEKYSAFLEEAAT
ncbi:hypothetical protein BH10BDE1_BH10BDE1_02000 [soil metagenome]